MAQERVKRQRGVSRIFLATKNPGKAAELEELLEPHGLHVVGPERMRDLPAPVEDGATFRANAVKKALHYSRLVDLPVLADDSGLEVDALEGRPGVRSARLGGSSASDADRVRLVLSQLEGVSWEKRTARFRCVIAIARDDVLLSEFAGSVEGRIAFEPAGAGGFGYDPIFYHEPAAMTFSEMTSEEKHRVSHRGQALERTVGWLLEQPWARTRES
jgi:XTP/dITP diphosphohydrolase